jgi:hypothetical protein
MKLSKPIKNVTIPSLPVMETSLNEKINDRNIGMSVRNINPTSQMDIKR